jgi:hypothetical protein
MKEEGLQNFMRMTRKKEKEGVGEVVCGPGLAKQVQSWLSPHWLMTNNHIVVKGKAGLCTCSVSRSCSSACEEGRNNTTSVILRVVQRAGDPMPRTIDRERRTFSASAIGIVSLERLDTPNSCVDT